MADLAKLASLSKRLKSSTPKVNEEKSNLGGPIGGGGGGDDSAPAPAPKAAAPASAPAATSAPVASGGGGGPTNVTVNVDLDPLKDMVSRVRDELKEMRAEIKKTREKGMKVELGDETAEQMDIGPQLNRILRIIHEHFVFAGGNPDLRIIPIDQLGPPVLAAA